MKGFTFIEVLIAVFLMVIIFLGVFGAYRLGLQVVGLSKNKITATAIANQKMEAIRNLPYLKVGTKGATLPYAQGILEQSTTTERNNVSYNIETKVKLISDSADGLDEAECDWDYKRAQVTVSWSGMFSSQVRLVTDVTPKDRAEEVAVCQEQPGGILSVTVFNAYGDMVSSPVIEIFDTQGNLVDSYSPEDGEHDFPLATSSYKVVVSKSDYSTSSTYSSEEIAHPEKPNPLVLEGEITEISFAIDEISVFSIDTLSPWGIDYWADSFDTTDKISEISNLEVEEGRVRLATSSPRYVSSGYLVSTEIDPSQIINWDKFSWSDSEPHSTDFKYQVYYATDTAWHLIPDSDLAGNSTGFDSSPVDLSDLATTSYPKLKLKGNASTTDASTTPVLEDWRVSWITSEATPIAEVPFYLRGEKTIGTDVNDEPVYKYSATSTSNGQGHIDLRPLEWDTYHFSSATSSLNLVDSDPNQPIDLAPNSTTSVELYLESQNSLLVTALNKDSLEPILGATTTLSNVTLNYNKVQYTDQEGQTYFAPLAEASYNLKVAAPGYNSTSTSVYVSGNKSETVELKQVE